MFKRDIGTWIAIIIIWWMMDAAFGAIPLLGYVAKVLDPVLAAGLVIGCDLLRRGNKLDISCLFAGFDRSHFGALLILGLVNLVSDLVGNALAIGSAMLFGASALVHRVQEANVMNVNFDNIDQMQQFMDRLRPVFEHLMRDAGPLLLAALPGFYVAIAMKFLFICAISIAFYFAQPLIMLDQQDAWTAIRHSWDATAYNWRAITVYGAWFVAVILGMLLPAFLCFGAAYLLNLMWLIPGFILLFLTLLVIAIPATVVGVTGAYLAYRDIFADLPIEQSRTRGLDEPARQH